MRSERTFANTATSVINGSSQPNASPAKQGYGENPSPHHIFRSYGDTLMYSVFRHKRACSITVNVNRIAAAGALTEHREECEQLFTG